MPWLNQQKLIAFGHNPLALESRQTSPLFSREINVFLQLTLPRVTTRDINELLIPVSTLLSPLVRPSAAAPSGLPPLCAHLGRDLTHRERIVSF